MSHLQANYAIETNAAMTNAAETDAAMTDTPEPGAALTDEDYKWAGRKHKTQHLRFSICLLFTFILLEAPLLGAHRTLLKLRSARDPMPGHTDCL